jgi:hypothetical protein
MSMVMRRQGHTIQTLGRGLSLEHTPLIELVCSLFGLTTREKPLTSTSTSSMLGVAIGTRTSMQRSRGCSSCEKSSPNMLLPPTRGRPSLFLANGIEVRRNSESGFDTTHGATTRVARAPLATRVTRWMCWTATFAYVERVV